jgi:hypothetical protein
MCSVFSEANMIRPKCSQNLTKRTYTARKTALSATTIQTC